MDSFFSHSNLNHTYRQSIGSERDTHYSLLFKQYNVYQNHHKHVDNCLRPQYKVSQVDNKQDCIETSSKQIETIVAALYQDVVVIKYG